VEIFLDQNNGKTTSYEKDDYQIRINFDNKVTFDHATPTGFKSKTSITDKGYIVEAEIPLLTEIDAKTGSVLGFDLQVNNDQDGDGTRDSVSIWCDSSGNSWQNLSGIGNIILDEEVAIPVILPSPSSSVTPTATVNPGNSNNQNAATPTPTTTPAASTPTPTAKITAIPTPTAKPSATSMPNSPKPAAGDISKHWAKDFITDLISKGIISGYADGTIKPDQNISRAELAVIIIKALGLKPAANTKVDFADAKNIPSWALSYIALAKEKGIIQGNADKTFLPNKECTRQEAITMIMRAFKLGESSKELKFKDVKDIQQWSYKFIAKATELELIKGYPDNTFKPGNSITRAELFTVVYKCLKK
jgi:endo-1,4-beta-xylanase